MRLVLALLAATELSAQIPPQIEVASVRVLPPNSKQGAPEISGNRLTRGDNVNQLVMYAWNLKAYQIAGGPAWVTHPAVESDYYEISAIAQGDEALTPATARLLLQEVLKERFGLMVHTETREVPVYFLVQGKSALRLKPGAPNAVCKSPAKVTLATVSMNFTGCTMDFLMQVLAGAADRPVLDRTGLAGAYDFKLEFARDPLTSDAPVLSTAVEEQLGLKLDAQKGPVEVTVMDRVERPSPN